MNTNSSNDVQDSNANSNKKRIKIRRPLIEIIIQLYTSNKVSCCKLNPGIKRPKGLQPTKKLNSFSHTKLSLSARKFILVSKRTKFTI